jgi:Rrf2 family nitric oxide-sensitive transcriptional repressor
MRLELTQSTDYALRAMLLLARSRDQTISGPNIARQTRIPARFVNQIMGRLVHAQLVDGIIGRTGGYRLSRDPKRISVLAIVRAVEGDGEAARCALRDGLCSPARPCEVHPVISGARAAFLGELASASLADIAANVRQGSLERRVPFREVGGGLGAPLKV